MILYTHHARDRMKQRRITEQEVEFCLKNYQISSTGYRGNPTYWAKLPDGRIIKVVVKAGSTNPQVIITVADQGEK